MRISLSLRGFVIVISIERVCFFGFLLREFGCAVGKVGAGSKHSLSLHFWKWPRPGG